MSFIPMDCVRVLLSVFSIGRSLRVLQKARIKIVGPAIYPYQFFSNTYSPVLLQNKKFLCRSSQIACMDMTTNITCTQATLCVHKNLCTVLIPMLKLFEFANLSVLPFHPVLGWLYHVLLPVRAIHCENCQLSIRVSTCHNWELFYTCPHRPL